MKAEIIAIGNELVIGDTQDTNSAYLSSQMIELGIEINSIKIIPDEINVIVEAIYSSYKKSDIILITGGLGPTEDDLTRNAVAKALKEEQYISPILRETITQYFKTRNIEIDYEEARKLIYGMSYGEWKKKYQKEATQEHLDKFKE